MLATPVAVLRRDAKGDSDLVELVRLVAEREVIEVVVGLPRSLDGGEGRAALIAREYASVLAERVAPVSVRMVDERLSTVEANRGLQQAGIKAKEARKMIDAAAAVVILQHALDVDRNSP
jgi:putative Holliday junction resolvase